MAENDRYVVNHPDGWAVKAENSQQASSVHSTQEDAINRAREVIANNGGGELLVQGTDGKIRQKNTIPPGNDPFPPRG